ncbi:hypothetical protein [Thalassolituus marinus]|uniref:Uncharacterized protein n=1 Tax=Thalassolituus marinus TaxID=671053 RepID=A0ABS7ZRP8_9GAMM|nr:hypothetical protein [Thalassolituus marinus]MCA6064326.1 hypothetical protein [Thalassolituus marinus]
MNLIRRLFATDDNPWCPPIDSVTINISGSELSFYCPNAYFWSSNSGVYQALVDETETKPNQLGDNFRLNQPGYNGQEIFYREWSHWGKVFRLKYIAVTSLRVWLIHVPKETDEDSLHVYDYLTKKFPLPDFDGRSSCLRENEKVTKMSGGLLGAPGDHQRTEYRRVCIMKSSGRELIDYSLLTLSSEYALVVEIYQAQAPGYGRFLMGELTDRASNIIDSLRLNLSPQELAAKEQVLRRYAEETGGKYDEE